MNLFAFYFSTRICSWLWNQFAFATFLFLLKRSVKVKLMDPFQCKKLSSFVNVFRRRKKPWVCSVYCTVYCNVCQRDSLFCTLVYTPLLRQWLVVASPGKNPLKCKWTLSILKANMWWHIYACCALCGALTNPLQEYFLMHSFEGVLVFSKAMVTFGLLFTGMKAWCIRQQLLLDICVCLVYESKQVMLCSVWHIFCETTPINVKAFWEKGAAVYVQIEAYLVPWGLLSGIKLQSPQPTVQSIPF